MTNRRAALVIAFVVLLIGLGLAFAPVSAEGVGCGNAFASNSTDSVAADLFDPIGVDHTAACEDALTTRRWLAFGLMTLAGLCLLFGLLTATGVESDGEQSRPAPQ